MPHILAGCFILFHLAGAGMAIHALSQKHSPQGTIAWILALLLLPWVGVPLYLLLGAARIRRHTSTRKSRELIECFLKINGAWQDAASRLSRLITCSTGYAPCSGNHARLLRDGNDTYHDLLQAIRQARESVLLECIAFFGLREKSQLNEGDARPARRVSAESPRAPRYEKKATR